MMHWNSAGEFFAMGGYALYVWGSFGVCLLVMILEPMLVSKRNRDIRAGLQRQRLADELEKEST